MFTDDNGTESMDFLLIEPDQSEMERRAICVSKDHCSRLIFLWRTRAPSHRSRSRRRFQKMSWCNWLHSSSEINKKFQNREKSDLENMLAASAARLTDLAYERLRDAIIELEIAPGAPIDEECVRDSFGFGLTPIRDALKRLSHERLVAIYPRRGTFATEINIADDQWISEIRAELESLAAALAAERATVREREALTALTTKMRKALTVTEFTNIDAQFHRLLYQASHNPLLENTLAQNFNLALRIWHFSVQNFSRDRAPLREAEIEVSLSEFELIAGAIERGDAEVARQAARRHIEYSRHFVRGFEHAD
jgi:DNA-binding GntR family transcriptional regulator